MLGTKWPVQNNPKDCDEINTSNQSYRNMNWIYEAREKAKLLYFKIQIL
jgi:hypothetical protein